MTNHLTDAEDAEAIAGITVTTTSEVLGCSTACICFDEQGAPEKTFIQRKEDGSLIRRELTDADEIRRRMEQLHDAVDITEQDYLYPIYGKNMILAVLRIPASVGESMTEVQTRMLHSIIESAALALERLRSLQQQAFIDEMTTIIPVGKGRVQIVEVQIPGESPVAGKKLWEITLPKEAIVGCVLRSDATLIPRGDTRILAGDTLVVITGNGQELNTIHALTGR